MLSSPILVLVALMCMFPWPACAVTGLKCICIPHRSLAAYKYIILQTAVRVENCQIEDLLIYGPFGDQNDRQSDLRELLQQQLPAHSTTLIHPTERAMYTKVRMLSAYCAI